MNEEFWCRIKIKGYPPEGWQERIQGYFKKWDCNGNVFLEGILTDQSAFVGFINFLNNRGVRMILIECCPNELETSV